jgi:hypothetical protein
MIGARVRVHWNLHRLDWSVTVHGLVVANVPDITLADVTFRVQPAGLARIRASGRRAVCAYAVGVVTAVGTGPDVTGMERVSFNPHRGDTFTCQGEPIWSAPLVVFKDAAGWVFYTEGGTDGR